MPDKVINLCFHGVGEPGRELEPGEAPYWVTEDFFLGVLDEVSARDDVRISFDDGNASDALIGLPALVERGLSGTFFILAGRLDRPGSLSRDQVRALVAAGMRVGSHGMDHVPWRGLGPVECRRELIEAREAIEETSGTEVMQAALPLGRYDRRTLALLKAAGYATVYSSDRRPARPDAWLQPRFSLRGDDTIDVVRAGVLAARSPWRLTYQDGLSAAKGLLKRLR